MKVLGMKEGAVSKNLCVLAALRGRAKRTGKARWVRGIQLPKMLEKVGVELSPNLVSVTLNNLCNQGLAEWRDIDGIHPEEVDKPGRKSRYEFMITPEGKKLVGTYMTLAASA